MDAQSSQYIGELWLAPDRRERWTRLMELFDPRPGEALLDVGFGNGAALRFLAERVGPTGSIGGIDNEPGTVERLQQFVRGNSIDNVDSRFGDAQNLPFPDSTFDGVLCVDVLEAVPEPATALAEIRRVLKPGGRALVAHIDIDSQAYTSSYPDLCREAVRAYAASTFDTYETSDGQMGRKLWGLFSNAGFERPRLEVLPLVNTEYREPLVGWVLSQFRATFISKVSTLTDEDLDRWRADLAQLSEQGRYLYCLNLYACIGSKK